MIRWSPMTELASLHNAMDRLFEDFFSPSTVGTNGDGALTRRLVPTYSLPLDVRETEAGYEIVAPVPGFSPDEVDVTFDDGVLKVQAQRSTESKSDEGGWLRREVAWGNYQRSIQLPGDINQEGISAHFENGVLTVTVPRNPRPQPKRIQVASNPQKQLPENG